ncbi:hypothetical protein BC332_10199 [Capsicum chinense]|nr:hypothetical protein BC332_10199 [Capsicum chinense]
MGIELNTNGSFIKVIGKAGAGSIVRKRNGQMIMVFVAPIQFCTNNYFEARAALIDIFHGAAYSYCSVFLKWTRPGYVKLNCDGCSKDNTGPCGGGGIIGDDKGHLVNLYNVTTSFTGSIPSSFSNMSTLETLSLNFNSIDGQIPKVIGSFIILRELKFRGNKLIGSIPLSLSNASRLETVDISYNSLQGNIPEEIGNLYNLKLLSIQYNQLTGSIPFTVFNIYMIEVIAFTGNSLSGSLPSGLCNGIIPQEIGNLVNLVLLAMERNQITGSVPNSIFNISSLQILSLSMNNLSGFLSWEIGNLTKMQHLQINENKLIGEIPKEISNLVELEELVLVDSSFSGQLDTEIFNISGLRIIDLTDNNLSGSLPPNIGSILPNIEELYLHNLINLFGTIPHCISNCSKLTILELSDNKLTGYRRGKRAPQQADSLSTITRERISYDELIQATDDLSENNLIGSGSFGSVYKGILGCGTAIAVKVFNLQLDAAFKSFDSDCEVLRSLHHRNLVKVITSCSNLDFKVLVLEYMPNGSLEKYLYSYNFFLDTKQRQSIMIDVACALEYLHHGCSLPVIHCDVKPSNVLRDEDMVAHLSDFGISKLLGEDQGELYTKTLATLGYIVLEYGLDGLVSAKCDVYSYGVMLLETLTRRKPNEFEGDLRLKQWVSYSLPEAEVEASPDIVSGTFIIFSLDVYVLLDPGSTLSYVTPYLAVGFRFKPDVIVEPFSVFTPVGDAVVARRVDYVVSILSRDTMEDLIELDMVAFDAILEMGRLHRCYAILDCRTQKGFLYRLIRVKDSNAESLSLQFVLVNGTYSAKELKEKLADLLDKGFIRPSVSPWGNLYSSVSS